MDSLNHVKVSKATWFFVHSTANESTGPRHPLVMAIVEQYAKDWRWEQVKPVFLLRERDDKTAGGQFGPHMVAQLPDQVFRLVAEFVQSKDVPKPEAHNTVLRGLEEMVDALRSILRRRLH